MSDYVKRVLRDHLGLHRTGLRVTRREVVEAQRRTDESMTAYLKQCQELRELMEACGEDSESAIDPTFNDEHVQVMTWKPTRS